MAFNNALAAALTNNLDPNHPGIANSHVISMFDLLNNVVKAPEKYDLTNVTDSCVEKGLTPLCNGYLFYDGKHPTAYVHKLIANEISKIIV